MSYIVHEWNRAGQHYFCAGRRQENGRVLPVKSFNLPRRETAEDAEYDLLTWLEYHNSHGGTSNWDEINESYHQLLAERAARYDGGPIVGGTLFQAFGGAE